MPKRLCPIEEAMNRQDQFFKLKNDNQDPDPYNFLLFAEHDHVYTCDAHQMTSQPQKLFRDPNDTDGSSLPSPLLLVKRGGSITYHGPGQIVCYLVIDLADIGIRGPVHCIAIIDATLKEVVKNFGIDGYTTAELRDLPDEEIKKQLFGCSILRVEKGGKIIENEAAHGLWVITKDNEIRKIASRGLKLFDITHNPENPRLVTKFGFALNVSTDLSFFDYINPCGLPIKMTSIEAITDARPSLWKVAKLTAEIMIRKLIETSEHKDI